MIDYKKLLSDLQAEREAIDAAIKVIRNIVIASESNEKRPRGRPPLKPRNGSDYQVSMQRSETS